MASPWLTSTQRKEVARVKFPDEPKGYGAIEGRLGAGVPSHGIGVAPDGKSLWATAICQRRVRLFAARPRSRSVCRAAGLETGGARPIGAIPDWVTFSPDSKTIYVGNSTFNSVSAIDMKTMKVVATIPVGQVPKRMNTLVMR